MKKNKLNLEPIEITIKCQKCGKPIVHSNKYGMFCEDWCELEESKKSSKFLEKLIKIFGGENV